MIDYPCTEFVRPNGERREGEISLSPETAQFFNDRKVVLSCEDCGRFVVLYVDAGWRVGDDEDGEPAELNVILRDGETMTVAADRAAEIIRANPHRPTFGR